ATDAGLGDSGIAAVTAVAAVAGAFVRATDRDGLLTGGRDRIAVPDALCRRIRRGLAATSSAVVPSSGIAASAAGASPAIAAVPGVAARARRVRRRARRSGPGRRAGSPTGCSGGSTTARSPGRRVRRAAVRPGTTVTAGEPDHDRVESLARLRQAVH